MSLAIVSSSRRKISPVKEKEEKKKEKKKEKQKNHTQIYPSCMRDMRYSRTRVATLARRNEVSADFRCSDSKLRYVASELQRRALLDFHSISSGIRSTFHPRRVRKEEEKEEREREHKLPLSTNLPFYTSPSRG